MLSRCNWCLGSPLYVDYHDNEWGQACFDSQRLFEFLLLEGMQAGLSWLTILKRRQGMKAAFFDFNPQRLADLRDDELDELMQDARIIRNRLKVGAVRKNAIAYLTVCERRDFSEYLWHFNGGDVSINHWRTQEEVPTETSVSKAMSRQLKKDGFSFVGPTICYAFMQAVGMVNDHLISCFKHPSHTS